MTDRNQAFGGADSAQFQKLSACLRKHGVNGFGSFRNPSGQRPRTGTTPNRRPTFTPARQTKQMKAFAACRKLLPSSGFGPRGGNPNRQGASPFQPSS